MEEAKSIIVPSGGKISVDRIDEGYTIEGPAIVVILKNAGSQKLEPAYAKPTN